jgi:hypothetical protein
MSLTWGQQQDQFYCSASQKTPQKPHFSFALFLGYTFSSLAPLSASLLT